MPSTLDEAEARTGARCAWCGAPAEVSAGPLARCPACGAGTTFPVPAEDELERAYTGWYRPASGRFSGPGDRVLAISRAALARRLDAIAPPGPLLDVGSGDGWLIGALRRRGREATGLERVAGGDGVLDIEITDFREREGEWAGVIFWHSLEHLADPAGAIDRATALLGPGGIVAIAVPNLDSWQARAFGERWFHLDLPRHLVHLSAASLQAGLRRRGLRIERSSHWRGGQILFGWLQGMVGALPGNLDLYAAIRRPSAQQAAIAGRRRAIAVATAGVLAPLALLLSAAEILAAAGGTVYLEARKP